MLAKREGESEKGRREKIRLLPMSEMLKLLERDTHTWDRWEVFTLKPEYQMPPQILARSLKTQVDPKEKDKVFTQKAYYRESFQNSSYSIQITGYQFCVAGYQLCAST